MTTTEEEFIKAINSFEPIMVKEEYRAYYDNDNKIMYLMANQFPDDNDNWLTITIAIPNTRMPMVMVRKRPDS